MTRRLRILVDQDGLVAVDKPPGLESTGRQVDDPAGVQAHLMRQLGRPAWLVHQLDRDTSGVLLFTRRKGDVSRWQATLKRGRKRYWAIVRGAIAPSERRVDAPLAYAQKERRWVVAPDQPGAKPSSSVIRPIEVGEEASLVEVELLTGRTHQARVHLAHLGHPVLGETRYGDAPCPRAPRHALHAWRVEVGGRVIEAPLPEDLREVLQRFGLPSPQSVL